MEKKNAPESKKVEEVVKKLEGASLEDKAATKEFKAEEDDIVYFLLLCRFSNKTIGHYF